MEHISQIQPSATFKYPSFWEWNLFHGLFFTTFMVLDWHWTEIYLPKNHGLLTMPVGLGLLQGYLLRNCLKKSYLLIFINPVGIFISFVGLWIYPALIGFGFGLVQAIFWWLQGYRRTFILVLASFAGWILGAQLWSLLPSQQDFPRLIKLFTEPLAQPAMGAGICYALSAYFAIRMLKQPTR